MQHVFACDKKKDRGAGAELVYLRAHTDSRSRSTAGSIKAQTLAEQNYRPHDGNQHVMHIHSSHTRRLLIGWAERDENNPNNESDVGERPHYFHLSDSVTPMCFRKNEREIHPFIRGQRSDNEFLSRRLRADHLNFSLINTYWR